MSKAQILEELPNLRPEERLEVLERICLLDRVAEESRLDTGELSAADRELLDARLAAYEKNPEAGSPWEEVEARIRARLNP